MIHKLRIKFIAASMLSLALVLLVILGGVNVMSYQKILRDSDHILSLLSENEGRFPQQKPHMDSDGRKPDRHSMSGHGLSPETPFESRFFSVLLDENGQIIGTDTGQIAALDQSGAGEFAQTVWRSGRSHGFQGDYRFIRIAEEQGVRLIFLDCRRILSNFRATLLSSLLIAVAGLLAVLLLLFILSGRIVRPMAESYEKQRRFITDAGHELKTPLTIIGADLDLVESEMPNNEWLMDIRRQVKRLTALTQDLIYLSYMEEEKASIQRIEFPISDVTEETAQSFLGPSKNQEKSLELDIQPMLSWTGDEGSIRQLLSILLDNALKYTPKGGQITVSLKKEGHTIRCTISNTIEQPMPPDSLNRLFDRFYRTDQSRNSQTGGYGLGLSIAKSIVTNHRGKIRAYCPEPHTLAICVEFPG